MCTFAARKWLWCCKFAGFNDCDESRILFRFLARWQIPRTCLIIDQIWIVAIINYTMSARYGCRGAAEAVQQWKHLQLFISCLIESYTEASRIECRSRRTIEKKQQNTNNKFSSGQNCPATPAEADHGRVRSSSEEAAPPLPILRCWRNTVEIVLFEISNSMKPYPLFFTYIPVNWGLWYVFPIQNISIRFPTVFRQPLKSTCKLALT